MNKLFLVQDVEPLGRLKDKLRSMCISSKKAKYTEIERIYKAISKIYLIFDKKKWFICIFVKNWCEKLDFVAKLFAK